MIIKKAIWITRDPGGVLYFCFAGESQYSRFVCSKDSYGYLNGGIAYKAAIDRIAELGYLDNY